MGKKLDESKFRETPDKGYWDLASNRRRFFESFAKESGFDPLVPKNWYSLQKDDLIKYEGAKNIFAHYENLSEALVDLFPFLDKARFKKEGQYRLNPVYIREFFEKFAKRNGFDPLVPHNWYQVSNQQIMSARGVHNVILHYKGISKALLAHFPDIGLEGSKILNLAKKMKKNLVRAPP